MSALTVRSNTLRFRHEDYHELLLFGCSSITPLLVGDGSLGQCPFGDLNAKSFVYKLLWKLP